MKYINDIEEKRLQILYFLSQKQDKVSNFSIENIFNQWCKWWKKDFDTSYQISKIFQNEITLSLPLEKCTVDTKYYIKVLKKTQNILVRLCHEDATNHSIEAFKEKLLECRRVHGKCLRKKLKMAGLNRRYYITHNSYSKNIYKLGRYILHDKTEPKDRYCYIGSYDKMRKYIEKNLIKNDFII